MNFKYRFLIILIFYSVFTENFKIIEHNSDSSDYEEKCIWLGCALVRVPKWSTPEKPVEPQNISGIDNSVPVVGNSTHYENKTMCFKGICFPSESSDVINSSTVVMTHKCDSMITTYHQMSYNKCCQYFTKSLNECVIWCQFLNQSLKMTSFNSSDDMLPTLISYPVPWPTVADPISWSTLADKVSWSTTEATEQYRKVEEQEEVNWQTNATNLTNGVDTNTTNSTDYENKTSTPHKCNAILNDYHQIAYNVCCQSYKPHNNRCALWCKWFNQSLEEISVNTFPAARSTLSFPVPLPTSAEPISWSTESDKYQLSTVADITHN